jgi:hypothetical protein
MGRSKLKKILEKEMTRKDFLSVTALSIVASVGVAGVIAELISHAEGPYTSVNPTTGSLAGGATDITSSTALSDKAVEFENSSSGTPPSSMQPNGPTGSWSLAWNDEFDDSTGSSGPANGLLNTKWNIGNNVGPNTPGGPGAQGGVTYGPNADDGDYHGPGTVKLPGDGYLHLQGVASGSAPDASPASYETYDTGEVTTAGLMCLNPASLAITNAALNVAISDGSVTVVDGPCSFEVRMRIQGPNQTNANLWWPVIWMSNGGNFQGGSASNWPPYVTSNSRYLVEQDYWEWYYSPNGTVGGGGNPLYTGGTFSMPDSYGNPGGATYNGAQAIPSSLATTDMSLAFHTYTVSFTADSLTLYVDGIIPTGWPLSNDLVTYNQQYPFFLIIALQSHQIGANLPDTDPAVKVTQNPPNTTAAGNNDMMIDYVRVWKQA